MAFCFIPLRPFDLDRNFLIVFRQVVAVAMRAKIDALSPSLGNGARVALGRVRLFSKAHLLPVIEHFPILAISVLRVKGALSGDRAFDPVVFVPPIRRLATRFLELAL